MWDCASPHRNSIRLRVAGQANHGEWSRQCECRQVCVHLPAPPGPSLESQVSSRSVPDCNSAPVNGGGDLQTPPGWCCATGVTILELECANATGETRRHPSAGP